MGFLHLLHSGPEYVHCLYPLVLLGEKKWSKICCELLQAESCHAETELWGSHSTRGCWLCLNHCALETRQAVGEGLVGRCP